MAETIGASCVRTPARLRRLLISVSASRLDSPVSAVIPSLAVAAAHGVSSLRLIHVLAGPFRPLCTQPTLSAHARQPPADTWDYLLQYGTFRITHFGVSPVLRLLLSVFPFCGSAYFASLWYLFSSFFQWRTIPNRWTSKASSSHLFSASLRIGRYTRT